MGVTTHPPRDKRIALEMCPGAHREDPSLAPFPSTPRIFGPKSHLRVFTKLTIHQHQHQPTHMDWRKWQLFLGSDCDHDLLLSSSSSSDNDEDELLDTLLVLESGALAIEALHQLQKLDEDDLIFETSNSDTQNNNNNSLNMDSLNPTKLAYFDDMMPLQFSASFLSCIQCDDGRLALILDSTIFHPQGGGQPADTGYIANVESGFRFVVEDVRLKDGLVYHYGKFGHSGGDCELKLEKGQEVCLFVDEQRRRLNSRLHSAGHLLDICLVNVGLGHLEPVKGYHFPDGPFVEYKGTVQQSELQSKQKELELDTNTLISKGGKVHAAVLPYGEALELCGGRLPDYISEKSAPRIVKMGDNPGCPCGGTHVADISELRGLKVSQIRTKKGLTKVFYTVDGM